ncbi:CDP-glucose 4,6-dehydratase [Pedosphaera parvula]|uniref:CDP-glucose 4,6-dehydratase n=1 Tax=Pedosphaera parvula (strain Ellin514) TaxID=320771 RepID=B9XIP5_PEDPL|nr:CDP-glucose 4,6-dehydratase [Pedosphaera parvula]EEF60308.1 CDP-glucose 4,6-dehydratase [Pedosphaera parvula Ellin514]
MFGDTFRNKTVWLSGHTGFKGAWLAQWLLNLGAKVHGYALAPNTQPSLFQQLALEGRLSSEIADIRDFAAVKKSILATQPDFVLHLAAQPLVRLSYEQPLETYATNVMGTAHVLESLRSLKKPCSAVMVTTDKCYENKEWVYGYREEDPLGGHDPYSSSKAAAEIVTSAYNRSFFHDHPVKISSARAGNVIGGGDWALDRIVPDCVRALQKGDAIPVRNKTATRPWQHVLEPLSGYLWLAAVLSNPKLSKYDLSKVAPAFNFGPSHESNRTVAELVTEVLKHWAGGWEDKSDPKALHEAKLLQLATDKAHSLLGWSPVWNFSEAIAHTAQWYYQMSGKNDLKAAQELTSRQIEEYSQHAQQLAISWALH